MRVISGTARRILLDTPEGLDTRPTSDRIKETLFNMLSMDLIDSNFLDLFAGSGQIGIEALSRGAKECIFVDQGVEAIKVINSNLERTKLTEFAKVYKQDVLSSLRAFAKHEPFDIVFMDPPYNKGLERRVLSVLKDLDSITEDTLVIVEAAKDTDFSYVPSVGFSIIKVKEYKTNKHIFLEKA